MQHHSEPIVALDHFKSIVLGCLELDAHFTFTSGPQSENSGTLQPIFDLDTGDMSSLRSSSSLDDSNFQISVGGWKA